MIGMKSQVLAKTGKPPKLVVGIVIDQMRWDYLHRFADRYGKGGFLRLMNEGFSCDNTMINYIPTYTAPGHACIYTGSVPSINGMAGNDWFDNNTGKFVYCTEDTSVSAIGGSRKAGMMSPRNLLATTITDELRLATNMRSRVFGISIKDRGAILPAGHLGNGAYWYDDSTGHLVSSSFYGPKLPEWLIAFNNRHLSDTMIRRPWITLYPVSSYVQSTSDNTPYEGNFQGEKQPSFPHLQNAAVSYFNLRRIPAGNTYLFEAGKACINGEKLGQSQMDFLSISLSATDYIGHQFGTNAIEIEDTYLRLDKDISEFLTYLDNKFGKGNYLVFLTADHGAAHNPRFLTDRNVPAGNEFESKLGKELKIYIAQTFKTDSLIRGFENYQVVFNEGRITSAGVDRLSLRNTVKAWLRKRQEAAYLIDMEDLANSDAPELIKTMAVNGYHRTRSGNIWVINNPGWFYGYLPHGTTHGSWNPYDAHIPLIWFGSKISQGSTHRTIHMEDIAPTLAALLNIQMPNGCVGKVIEEVVK
jgi:hypothetical protein